MERTEAPELTRRALITGALIGALLTPCNVYSGLKIGWSFNMSIAAALLSYAFWQVAERGLGTRHWGLLENNINQTTASSAASIISGGLVAPIPALTLITGQQLGWASMWLWVFAVSALGIVVAVLLRGAMIERTGLAFPAGVATAETVTQIYRRGREATLRVRALASAALLAGSVKLVLDLGGVAARLSPPLGIALPASLARGGVGTASFKNLGLSLDSSLLMLGFGAIIGPRAGVSLLAGALIAWLGLAPWVIERGWAEAGPADGIWFGALVEWLIWPGVAMMTTASLTAFGLTLLGLRSRARGASDAAPRPGLPVPLRAFAIGAAIAVTLAVIVQQLLFGIPPLAGLIAVLRSLALAVVAARVVGETGIPPIGAIGKVAQLSFGLVAPGNVTANLMGANVTGGAAGQCADLLNDLKCGHLVGATPRRQIAAQCLGVLTGSLVGSLSYLLLIPDPATMLLTAEWPAPAVATWKAVAEVLARGLQAIPEGATTAMLIGAATGVALAAAEALLPPRARAFVPSGAGLGLAFVIPAWISVSLFLGAALASLAARLFPQAAARFTLPIAAGLVAGESIAGVAGALLAAG